MLVNVTSVHKSVGAGIHFTCSYSTLVSSRRYELLSAYFTWPHPSPPSWPPTLQDRKLIYSNIEACHVHNLYPSAVDGVILLPGLEVFMFMWQTTNPTKVENPGDRRYFPTLLGKSRLQSVVLLLCRSHYILFHCLLQQDVPLQRCQAERRLPLYPFASIQSRWRQWPF